ncbi:MAG: SDR family oxidoreductase [Pseudonocardiales bacterium]|nr:SDR family oxidoreductase [Pseudonocardiales bacterium]
MNSLLKGRRALITGGTRGIGRAISIAFARAEAKVITCYRQDEKAGKLLAEELSGISNGNHHVVPADVSTPDGVSELVNYARGQWDGIDAVVHNAGQISHIPLGELPPAEWHRVVDTSLTAAYLVVREALPLLSAGSSVTMIGSGAAMIGIPLRAHYTAAKAGQLGLMRSMAKELGPKGIRVNVLSPGPTHSEKTPENVLEMYRKRIPMGRLGEAEEVASAAVFLASDMATFVNGANLHVDGGI